uniref:DNA polymerase n=1 Tax=Russula foetens TaxID=131541 RepID=A0A2S0U3V3_9AGAM|nr:hypothetical protein [Russula foetens]AWB36167.1 hypothetical protein [Russula foetens]
MLKNKLNWIDFKINIKNTNFSSKLLKDNLNIFWKEVIETKVSANQHIWLLFRLQWTDNNFVTIGKLQKLNKEDKDWLFDFIIKNMDDKSEYYNEQIIKSMIFSYTIKKGRAKDKITFESSDLQYQNYQHHKLPITMNPLEYGKLIDHNDNKYWVQVNRTNIAIITQLEEFNEIKFFKEGDLIYQYKDHKIDENTFIRSLDNKKFTFKNNELILLAIDKSVKFIKPLTQLNEINNKIITLDIETYVKDNILKPYCISWFNGNTSHSYFINDYNNIEYMIKAAIKDFMIKKYDNYKVYIHNMAGFDAIFFLLKILANLGDIKPIIHHDKLISIGFKFNGYNITFKDSQQMLIFSLRNLAKAFGVNIQKSYFPYDFVKENNLDYIGITPDLKYFNGISHDEYDGITSYNWNLRNEAIKYCEIDCISLYQILTKFNTMIFDLFKINIHKYPTLSSLSFAIFRTHFLKMNTIPQLTGQIAKDIRLSYTGGAVDMYQPFNEEGTKIHCYDVNALYPFTMEDKLMPTGKPIFFKGDIRKVDPNAFGFFFCNIETPTDLLHPIIQTHINTEHGLRTIAPLGQWSDMIFSSELDNAMKLGYKFEILWGYKFEPENVFKDYVDCLYQMRLNYPKSNPLNLVAKLLMNSLYGRFGMIDEFPDITIFRDKKSFNEFMKNINLEVLETIELGDKLLVKYRSEDKNQQTMLYGNLETHNVSIAIAAAITAYARIHMSKFKNNPKINLYYSDTDSIYTDSEIADELISNIELGKLKLENTAKKAIFLAPKLYCLLTNDNKREYLLFSFRKLTIFKLRFFKI